MFPTFTVALNGETLYAVWKAGVVNVAFFAMGGSDNAVLSGSTDDSVAIPAEPTRTGYTFEGWYTEPDGGGNKLDTATGGSITLATATPAAYYAKWTAETYTVTLKLNGGNISGETADVTRDGAYGAQVTYTEPTRPGYTFTGWKAGEADAVTKFITFPAKDTSLHCTVAGEHRHRHIQFHERQRRTTVLTGEFRRGYDGSRQSRAAPAIPLTAGASSPSAQDYKCTPAGTFPTSSTAYYAQWTAKKVRRYHETGRAAPSTTRRTTCRSPAVTARSSPTPYRPAAATPSPAGSRRAAKTKNAVLYLTYPLDDATVYEAVWKAIPAGGGGAACSGGTGTGTDGTTLSPYRCPPTEGNTHAAVSVEGRHGHRFRHGGTDQSRDLRHGKETGTVVVDVSNLERQQRHGTRRHNFRGTDGGGRHRPDRGTAHRQR
jgi:uncharacterized repeat protein (TIGR02543 family)